MHERTGTARGRCALGCILHNHAGTEAEWTTARLEFQGALDACRHSILARAEELLSDSRALYFVVPLIGNMVDTLSPSLQDTGIKAARQRGASHIVRLLFRALLGRILTPCLGLQVGHLGRGQQGHAQRA